MAGQLADGSADLLHQLGPRHLGRVGALRQEALRRLQEPAARGVAEDADERDGVPEDGQHGDAAAGDDAIVEPQSRRRRSAPHRAPCEPI